MSEVIQQQIDAMKAQFESKLNELQRSISKNLTSRRGAEGARGEKGDPGVSNIPGPQGQAGRDANIGECVAVAKTAFESEIAALHASLDSVVLQKLKDAGVVDASGNAILIAGPAGPAGRDGVNGKDSTVVGPAGESIIGPQGEKGPAGESIVGPRGPQGEPGVSNTPGPQGDRGEKGEAGPEGKGTPGPRGPAGDIQAAVHNSEQLVKKLLEEFKRSF